MQRPSGGLTLPDQSGLFQATAKLPNRFEEFSVLRFPLAAGVQNLPSQRHRAIHRSLRRNRVLDRLQFDGRQFNERGRIGLKLGTKLHQVEMPAFDANRPAVFLDDALNGA
jgi:hypothetical protein